MLNVGLGLGIFGATAFGFWNALPTHGKLSPLFTPRIEPYVAILFVAGATLGLGLLLVGGISIFNK